MLTGCRVRDIRSLSWRPASVDTEHGAQLPANPTKRAYQGEMVGEAMVRLPLQF
jgi:hypothetical protein